MDTEALTRRIIKEVLREVQAPQKRPLITREDVMLACLEDRPLRVPPGALVTPWAKSLARDLGVELRERKE